MKTTLIATVAAAAVLALAACGDPAANSGYTRVTQNNAAQYTLPAAFPAGVSIDRLEGAELIDANGREIGEVRAVLADGGEIVAVAVDLDIDGADGPVVLSLRDVTPTRTGPDEDDIVLRTTLTEAELLGRPSYG